MCFSSSPFSSNVTFILKVQHCLIYKKHVIVWASVSFSTVLQFNSAPLFGSAETWSAGLFTLGQMMSFKAFARLQPALTSVRTHSVLILFIIDFIYHPCSNSIFAWSTVLQSLWWRLGVNKGNSLGVSWDGRLMCVLPSPESDHARRRLPRPNRRNHCQEKKTIPTQRRRSLGQVWALKWDSVTAGWLQETFSLPPHVLLWWEVETCLLNPWSELCF